jgi:hypothetical protein
LIHHVFGWYENPAMSVRAVAILLETLSLVLLATDAIGERRAARWKEELKEADKAMEALSRGALGDESGQRWWRLDVKRYFLLWGESVASVVMRFDAWKQARGLANLIFVLALALGAAGVALSLTSG